MHRAASLGFFSYVFPKHLLFYSDVCDPRLVNFSVSCNIQVSFLFVWFFWPQISSCSSASYLDEKPVSACSFVRLRPPGWRELGDFWVAAMLPDRHAHPQLRHLAQHTDLVLPSLGVGLIHDYTSPCGPVEALGATLCHPLVSPGSTFPEQPPEPTRLLVALQWVAIAHQLPDPSFFSFLLNQRPQCWCQILLQVPPPRPSHGMTQLTFWGFLLLIREWVSSMQIPSGAAMLSWLQESVMVSSQGLLGGQGACCP